MQLATQTLSWRDLDRNELIEALGPITQMAAQPQSSDVPANALLDADGMPLLDANGNVLLDANG